MLFFEKFDIKFSTKIWHIHQINIRFLSGNHQFPSKKKYVQIESCIINLFNYNYA